MDMDSNLKKLCQDKPRRTESVDLIAFHVDVLRRSSRVTAPLTSGAVTRDESLRTSEWEAIDVKVLSLK